MWEENAADSEYEPQFQKMLVNNMEHVIKVFFRGVKIKKIKTGSLT